MPPLPNVGQTVRIDWQQKIGEDTNVLTRVFWSYTIGTGITVATCNAIATAARVHWAGDLEPSFGTFHSLEFTTVTDLASSSGPVGTDNGTATGVDAGDPLAADTAMRLKFFQAHRYRGGHPGVYLGGLVEDRLQDPQTWSAATIAEFTAAWQNLVAHLAGAGDAGATLSNPVAISYYSGFTAVQNPVTLRWRNVPKVRPIPTSFPITAFEVDAHVSSQRRRSLIRS